jgi:2-methylisocitrate lyase-like PEP mutase family enzyme
MSDSASRFRALHAREKLFVMPNPWDAGTARLLADLGFEAIATSSAALAWTLAKPDAKGGVTRDDAIAHARLLGKATGLPVNGDFESGYGNSPAEVAKRSAAQSTPASPGARSRTWIRRQARSIRSARRSAVSPPPARRPTRQVRSSC